MINEIFNNATAGASTVLTVGEMMLVIGLSLVFGLVISITYMLTHRTYQRGFAITLTMLPVILAMIILFVGSNIARAFSLAGTLSIIRFRSAPGDPEDIGYIFFDIAAGLACGVGLYLYGAAFVLIVCLFMIVISKLRFGVPRDSVKVLKILIPENLHFEGIFDDTLEKYTKLYELTKVKTTDLGSIYELHYDITMKKGVNEKEFLDELRCRNGNLSIILSVAATELFSQ